MSSSSNNIESELQAQLGAVANDNVDNASAAIAASAAAAAAAAREHQQNQEREQQQAQQEPRSPTHIHTYASIQPANPSVDQSSIHPDLRGIPATTLVPTANMMPASAPGEAPSAVSAPGPVNPALAAGNLAQVAPAPQATAPGQVAQPPPDGRKNKRELSQSKRAAQNRAAQRAFRQRKEGYIKKLEAQVQEFAAMEQAYKQVQADNHALRSYVMSLQAYLIDPRGKYPHPPEHLNLHPVGQQQERQAGQPMNNVPEAPRDAQDLDLIKQAVRNAAADENQASMRPEGKVTEGGQHIPQPPQDQPQQQSEDVTMEDEVARQLQSEGPGQS